MSLFSLLGKRSGVEKSINRKRTIIPRLEILESRDLLSIFTVTNTSGDANASGSLPWAVQQADNTAGSNTIDFNIPGSGIQTITISGVLNVTNPVTIDGTSQPGYNGTPLISVQGSASVNFLFGLTTGSSGSTIEGLDLFDYTGNAVTIANTSSGDTIQNNWLGFFRDPNTGHVTLNNSLGFQSLTSGLGIQSSNNTIRSNVIDGSYNAINVGEDPSGPWSGTVYSGNTFTGNYIGTDPTGTTSAGYGNTESGIFLGAGCQHNFIGPNNVFSGNGAHGVEMFAPSDTGNVIFGNKIGTDVNGKYAIPNGDGVSLTDGANGNTIGGASGGNLISGNKLLSINLGLTGYGTANNNWVQNNIIGLNANQSAIISPGTLGIAITAGSSGNHVLSNVICGASAHGVLLTNTTSNIVNQNWIGESAYGVGFGNGQNGVALLSGANYNYVENNAFGINGAGPVYVDPNAIGNVITGVPGAPPSPPSASNVGATVQQLFQAYAMAFQDLGSGNVSAFFQDIQQVIALYFTLVSEIFAGG